MNLEDEFKSEYKKFQAEFAQAESELSAAAAKMANIAEKYGMPLEGCVYPVYNTYFPKSFKEKWKDLNEDFLNQYVENPNDYDDRSDFWGWLHDGWQHSSWCAGY